AAAAGGDRDVELGGAAMTRPEKAKRIGEILDRLYPMPPIPLHHGSAFQLLVAVVLSAQTTDAQVNRVTPALFRRAPTPEKLAAMSETDILKLIRSCGLAPGKARRLKELARTLVDEYGGEGPPGPDGPEEPPPRGRE